VQLLSAQGRDQEGGCERPVSLSNSVTRSEPASTGSGDFKFDRFRSKSANADTE
jgi:hypothetical protein